MYMEALTVVPTCTSKTLVGRYYRPSAPLGYLNLLRLHTEEETGVELNGYLPTLEKIYTNYTCMVVFIKTWRLALVGIKKEPTSM